MNIFLIFLLCLIIFAIIGTNYFKGMYFYCDSQPFGLFIDTKWACLDSGGVWINFPINFDNVLTSARTLFAVASAVGWAEIMYKGIQARGIDLEPEIGYNMSRSFFFMVFIIIGNFFTLNFFVSVVISSYNR